MKTETIITILHTQYSSISSFNAEISSKKFRYFKKEIYNCDCIYRLIIAGSGKVLQKEMKF